MNKVSPCSVDKTLKLIGGKWKIVILWHLSQGKHRFSELDKKIDGVTQKMLTQSLRELERDGLVDRKVYPIVPPKVEYSLTKSGKSLEKALKELDAWGSENL